MESVEIVHLLVQFVQGLADRETGWFAVLRENDKRCVSYGCSLGSRACGRLHGAYPPAVSRIAGFVRQPITLGNPV